MSYFRSTVCCLALLPVLAVCALAQGELKKVTQSEAVSAAVSKVQPEYPPIARQLKLQGVAELEMVVAEDGTVEKVNIVSGNPVLTKPSSEALKKWKFKPFVQDGKPVKVTASMSFKFAL